jgi:nitrite reductase/ring-hydroxylating ferredoxin subunit
MSEFHRVCQVGDIPEGEGRACPVGNKVIAIFCHGGQFHAIDDCCPHMGASLAGGYVENNVVTCPWHAWRFNITDGTWQDNKRLKIGSYPVKVEGNDVLVQVEDKK